MSAPADPARLGSPGASVDLADVRKEFFTDAGIVRAVDGVSLSLEPGASLAVTGPSGCGKSTLLSMIGALEPPTGGSVVIGEDEVSSLQETQRAEIRRRRIGFVFQADNLQPFLSAAENVSLQQALAGEIAPADSGRARELIAALGVGHAADRFPDQLSGGERQRVALARAIVHRPELILADEPTGALDAKSSRVAVDLLLAAREESGATLIVITHDPAVAARMDLELRMLDGAVDAGPAPAGAEAERPRLRAVNVGA